MFLWGFYSANCKVHQPSMRASPSSSLRAQHLYFGKLSTGFSLRPDYPGLRLTGPPSLFELWRAGTDPGIVQQFMYPVSTLQNLRNNGEVSSTKLKGKLDYKASQFEEIHSRK